MISTYPMKWNVFKIPQSAQHLVHQQFRHWVETIWWMFWNEHGGTFPLHQMMMTKIYHLLLTINCLIWIYELYHIRHLSNFIAVTVRVFPPWSPPNLRASTHSLIAVLASCLEGTVEHLSLLPGTGRNSEWRPSWRFLQRGHSPEKWPKR